jgi:tRNA(fMet)-specific endonuclease VapC
VQYMLDTDICIYIAKRKPASVQQKLLSLSPGDACLSAVTYAELRYGAEKSERREQNLQTLERLRNAIAVQAFDELASEQYGEIRAHLEKKGQIIGGNDLLIAAHAKSLGLTLVTNNVREFKRVPDLAVEFWR